ncbi:hypothetical protein L7F22_056034 [Adiantum nelumboides]|nr:hypothetical protein [Adiantum nelumboides]
MPCPSKSSHTGEHRRNYRLEVARLKCATRITPAYGGHTKASSENVDHCTRYLARLEESYLHKDVASQILNLKKLVNMTLSDEQVFPKFVDAWRLQLDETTLSGVDLSTNVQAMLLLASLPSSWQPFITTRTAAHLSVPTLIPAILQENTLRSTIGSTSSVSSMAMYASRPSRSSSSSHRFRSSSKSFSRSSRPDHRPKPVKQGFRLTKPYCKICAKEGHKTSECWHKNKKKTRHHNQAHYASDSDRNTPSTSPGSSTPSSPTSDDGAHLAFMASHDYDINSHTTWILDTDKKKNTILNAFQSYHKLVENQLEHNIKTLQSDNGSEYTNNSFQQYLSQHGISQRFTVPSTPQQNGLAERKNRTLLDSARAMLTIAVLPHAYWQEAVTTACYIQNRVYHRSIDAIPYTLWFGRVPDFAHLRIFGSIAYAYVSADHRSSKLDSHAIKAILVGYDSLISSLSTSATSTTTPSNTLPPTVPSVSNSKLPSSSSSVVYRVPLADPLVPLAPPPPLPAAAVPLPLGPPVPVPQFPILSPPPLTPNNLLEKVPASSTRNAYHDASPDPSTTTQTFRFSARRPLHTATKTSHSHRSKRLAERTTSAPALPASPDIGVDLHSSTPAQRHSSPPCAMSLPSHTAADLSSSSHLPSQSYVRLQDLAPSTSAQEVNAGDTSTTKTRSLSDIYESIAPLDALVAEYFTPTPTELALVATEDLCLSGEVNSSPSVADALRGPEADHWRCAMESEITTNGT